MWHYVCEVFYFTHLILLLYGRIGRSYYCYCVVSGTRNSVNLTKILWSICKMSAIWVSNILMDSCSFLLNYRMNLCSTNTLIELC